MFIYIYIYIYIYIQLSVVLIIPADSCKNVMLKCTMTEPFI